MSDPSTAVATKAGNLSVAEKQRMVVYESAVEAGFVSQNAQILAMVQIRDERLYRAEYGTFDAYCERRWGKSAHRVNELIRAASVIKNISENNGTNSSEVLSETIENGTNSSEVLPNTSQATELAKLDDPEEQVEVWQEVVTSGEPVTAEVVNG